MKRRIVTGFAVNPLGDGRWEIAWVTRPGGNDTIAPYRHTRVADEKGVRKFCAKHGLPLPDGLERPYLESERRLRTSVADPVIHVLDDVKGELTKIGFVETAHGVVGVREVLDYEWSKERKYTVHRAVQLTFCVGRHRYCRTFRGGRAVGSIAQRAGEFAREVWKRYEESHDLGRLVQDRAVAGPSGEES